MRCIKTIILTLFVCICCTLSAQQSGKTFVHIEHADYQVYDEAYGKGVERLIGNVALRQDSTFFYSDSAHFNEKTRYFDGYGNVHIKVNDTTDIFSDKCKYSGDIKFAELFDNVILKDDSTVLKTNYLTYDREAHLATYPKRGTITRNNKKLVSRKGYYRDDIEVAYFRKDVVVTTPKCRMLTDTLEYRIKEEKIFFYGPTTIYYEDYVLVGNYGWYDAANDIAYLDRRATLSNQGYSITADTMFYNRKTEFAQAKSNVFIHDTVNKAILEGNYGEMWKNIGKTFVTDSARMRYYADKDTLFQHSDTLFFYINPQTNKAERILSYYNVRFYRRDIQGKCDSLNYLISDSTAKMRGNPMIWAENSQLRGDSINIVMANRAIDSVLLYPNGFIIQKDTIEGFNQIKGKTMTAYFKDNELDHVYDDGNAETVYWLREEDGSMIGINVSQSTAMDIEIEKNQIVRIKYFKKTTETLYPKEKIKEGAELLKGFEWREELRPTGPEDIYRKEVKVEENAGKTRRKGRRK
jgi:lipopolysaccharide export system protein LptA